MRVQGFRDLASAFYAIQGKHNMLRESSPETLPVRSLDGAIDVNGDDAVSGTSM